MNEFNYQKYIDMCSEWPWITIFMYFGVLVAFLFALHFEYKDLFCPEPGQPCRVGCGAVHEAGKPHPDDSIDELLQKIRYSSRYDESSVYWRRSIVFTSILLFAVLILTQCRLPNAYEVLVAFIVIYMVIFLFLSYYQEVVSLPGSKQVDKATYLIHKKYHRK